MPICPVRHNEKDDCDWDQNDFNSFKKFVKDQCEEMGDCIHSRFYMSLIALVRNRNEELE